MKTTYSCLLKMKQNADWAHDQLWDLGCYEAAIRYTKIAQRILKAMCNTDNKLNYLK